MTSKLKAVGGCSSHHLQGHIVVATLQSTMLVSLGLIRRIWWPAISITLSLGSKSFLILYFLWSENSQEQKVYGTFTLWTFCTQCGLFTPSNEKSWEQKVKALSSFLLKMFVFTWYLLNYHHPGCPAWVGIIKQPLSPEELGLNVQVLAGWVLVRPGQNHSELLKKYTD